MYAKLCSDSKDPLIQRSGLKKDKGYRSLAASARPEPHGIVTVRRIARHNPE